MKKYYLYIILSIANAFLFLIIPDYFFWFLMILCTVAFICLAVIVIDIFGKTNNWKKALIILGSVTGSYGLGLLTIVIRNYFLAYYSH
jgi:hypothetical protein